MNALNPLTMPLPAQQPEMHEPRCPFCGAHPFRWGSRLYCNGNHDETHTRIEMFDFQWRVRATEAA